jgi:hypothetical protein
MAIPKDTQSITAEWMSEALSASTGKCTVASLRVERIGEDQGWTGQVSRIDIEYSDAPPEAPDSVVAKFSPRDTDGVFGVREVNFYQEIAEGRGFAVPRCYHSASDQRTGDNITLLEDLSRLHTVAFVDGCTPAQAEAAVLALAKIHARWWNDPTLESKDWLFSIADSAFAEWWAQYRSAVGRLLPHFELSLQLLEFGDRFASDLPAMLERIEGAPFTCIHRDIHLDNLLFGSGSDDPKVVLVDWQTVGMGRGISDIAYLLISSLSPADRRTNEHRLVGMYHDYLLSSGVEDYSLDQCWSDYLVSVASKLFITVTATINFDNTSAHRRAWRTADLERLTAFFDDHDPISEL